MNAAMIKTGKPQADGRYVAFVQCSAAAARDWVEPIIVTWANDRWHTSFLPVSRILGWIGPLPVMNVRDLWAAPIEESPEYLATVALRAQEYDL